MSAFLVWLSTQRRLAQSCLVIGSLAVGLGVFVARQADAESPAGGVSVEEAAEGFESLFDGKTLAGWHGSGSADGYYL